MSPIRRALAAAACVSLAAAAPVSARLTVPRTWHGGQVAEYTVRVTDGPAYRVRVKVPRGVVFEYDTTPSHGKPSLDIARRDCLWSLPAAARREGDTFEEALHDTRGDRFVGTGHGRGKVRWAEFQDTLLPGGVRYLVALHPGTVVRGDPEILPDTYYGFEVNTFCLSRRVATRLVRTVQITPL